MGQTNSQRGHKEVAKKAKKVAAKLVKPITPLIKTILRNPKFVAVRIFYNATYKR